VLTKPKLVIYMSNVVGITRGTSKIGGLL